MIISCCESSVQTRRRAKIALRLQRTYVETLNFPGRKGSSLRSKGEFVRKERLSSFESTLSASFHLAPGKEGSCAPFEPPLGTALRYVQT